MGLYTLLSPPPLHQVWGTLIARYLLDLILFSPSPPPLSGVGHVHRALPAPLEDVAEAAPHHPGEGRGPFFFFESRGPFAWGGRGSFFWGPSPFSPYRADPPSPPPSFPPSDGGRRHRAHRGGHRLRLHQGQLRQRALRRGPRRRRRLVSPGAITSLSDYYVIT